MTIICRNAWAILTFKYIAFLTDASTSITKIAFLKSHFLNTDLQV